MKWKDHKRLINAAAQRYRVPLPVYRGLMQGVVDPDKNPETSWRINRRGVPYQVTESHHNPDSSKIVKQIWHARRFWLAGKEYEAGFQLGRALHYIHDGFVSKGFLGWSHDSNESRIGEMNVNDSAVYLGVIESQNDPFYVEGLAHNVISQNPEEAFKKAAYVTAAILKAVFSERTVPGNLQDEYMRAQARHGNYLKAAFGAGIVIFFSGAVLESGMMLIIAPVIGYVIVRLDERYYRIKKMRDWFSGQ